MRTRIAVAGCFLLASCCCPPTPDPNYTALSPTANLEAGRLVCDVNSLATQKDQIIRQRDELRSVDGQEIDSTALQKMHEFDASIDAEYRNVITACRAYIQCMDMNNYSETACHSAETRWRESEQTFSDLSVKLKRLSHPPGHPKPPPGSPLGQPAPGFPPYGFTGAPQDP